ncbi:hypothetical protein HY989_06835 [Candidatus Micrarchaeota archaeon]|nr:hypothetical protein [Candidatus Micrarchaeota archaeon]
MVVMKGQTFFEMTVFFSLGAVIMLIVRNEIGFLLIVPATFITQKILRHFRMIA